MRREAAAEALYIMANYLEEYAPRDYRAVAEAMDELAREAGLADDPDVQAQIAEAAAEADREDARVAQRRRAGGLP